MATNSYFEAALPIAGAKGRADDSLANTSIEILVSSYSGEHVVYLKIADPNGDERSLVLSKDTRSGYSND